MRLRKAPDQFEKLRGNYPERHEPSAYRLNLLNDEFNYKEKFIALGFQME